MAESYALDGGKQITFSAQSVEFAPNTWTHVVLIYENDGEAQREQHWRFKISVDSQETHGPAAYPVCSGKLKVGDAARPSMHAPSPEPVFFTIAEATIWHRSLSKDEVISLYSSHAKAANLSLKTLNNMLDQIELEIIGKNTLDDTAREQLIDEFKRHSVIIGSDRSIMTKLLKLVESYEKKYDGLFLNDATKWFGLDRSKTSIHNIMFWVQQAALDDIYTTRIVAGCAVSLLDGIKWRTARHFPGEVDIRIDPSLKHIRYIMATVGTYWGKQVRQHA